MSRKIILSIETSCDDTCVCLYDYLNDQILSNLISRHVCAKGIIPESVARSHTEALPKMVELALKEGGLCLQEVDIVTATYGPGLIGSLVVGLSYGKALAWSLNKPFFAAHHIEGHILSVKHAAKLNFPYGCLVISGGHTLLCIAEDLGTYKIFGQSVDDSAGECFDKIARELGLKQPGGPEIENLAKSGSASITLPNPLPNSLNFSFSGLKTAAKRSFNGQNAADVAASLLGAISRSLCEKVEKFCQEVVPLYRTSENLFPIGIVGGVAANKMIFNKIKEVVKLYNCELFVPPMQFCTDNAFMIAFQASLYAAKGRFSSLDHPVISKISIENLQ